MYKRQALDFKTDAALRHALQDETRDAAVLIIAQRISTILHADQIVVLKDGEIVGLGTVSYTHLDPEPHCRQQRQCYL